MATIPALKTTEQSRSLAWYQGFRWAVPAAVLLVVTFAASVIAVLGLAEVLPWGAVAALIAAIVVPGIAVSLFLSLPHRVVFDEGGVHLHDRFIPWSDVHLFRMAPPHRIQLQLHLAVNPRWEDAEVVEVSFPEDLREPLRRFVSEQVQRAHGRRRESGAAVE